MWEFVETTLKGKKEYHEIKAQNVTKLYLRQQELAEKNRELEEVGERLQSTYKSVVQVGQERELMSYKMRIHDELGNAILRGSRLMRMENVSPEEKAGLIDEWERTLDSLKSNARVGKEAAGNIYEDVRHTAASLGVRLIFKGDRPVKSEVLAYTVREAVYNSVRHGGADIVVVEGKSEDRFYYFEISDNAVKKPSEFKEGGGLSNIRKAIETAGGNLKIEVGDRVVLRVTLPAD